MQTTMAVEDIKLTLPELLDSLTPGDEVILTRNQQPVAKLVSEAPRLRRPRTAGNCIGMIRIDDDATVHALFQAHTFEDRMLKIDRVRVRARATVGCGSVLFYGVDVGEDATVAAQSVIMKQERLAPRQRYEGCPSAPTR